MKTKIVILVMLHIIPSAYACIFEQDWDDLINLSSSVSYYKKIDAFDKENKPQYWMHIDGQSCNDFSTHCINLWKKSQERYKNNQCKRTIPLVLHFIWLDSNTPEWVLKNVAAWEKILPDWKVRLWTDNELATFNSTNKNLLLKAENPAQKADILRYEILYRYGGVYLDVDCLPINTELLREMLAYCDFAVALEPFNNWFCLGNAFIMARPYHPIIASCVAALTDWQKYAQEKIDNNMMPNWMPICLKTGPGYLSFIFFSYLNQHTDNDRILILPPTFAYPAFKNTQPIITPYTALYHLFKGSWL